MRSVFFLYWLFTKIGIFTFGGGYAMIPLFYDELVTKYNFLTDAEFGNMVALAQVTPGPVGLNVATYIGYQQAGVWGAAAGTLGVMTVSLVLATSIAMGMKNFQDSRTVQFLLLGIRPATLGLIAAAVVFFADASLFEIPLASLWQKGEMALCWQGIVIFAAVLIARLRFKVPMIWVLAGSAAAGYLLFLV